MKESNILITSADYAKLNDMIALGDLSSFERREAAALWDELKRAEIVEPDAVPPGVITMNSRAELIDLESGERMELTLSYPGESDFSEGKVSVLAPVGYSMLGARVGDIIECEAPFGVFHLKVLNVTFQPEAAFASVPG